MVEKNAIDCRPMKSAIDHAIGSRQSGVPAGAATGSWGARTASGTQTTAATSAGSAQIASVELPPAERVLERDRGERRDGRAGHQRHRVRAHQHARPLRRPRPDHAGTTTCESAIAAPANSVPSVQRRDPAQPAQPGPKRGRARRRDEQPLDGIAARDPRPELREQPRGRAAGRSSADPPPRPTVRVQTRTSASKRRETAEQRSQVEADQDDRDQRPQPKKTSAVS